MGWDVAIERARSSIIPKTYDALARYGYLQDLRREVRKAKEEVVRKLDFYIEELRKSVERIGGRFYLAGDGKEAADTAAKIVGRGKVVVMGKNNVASETKLHKRLEEEGNEVWETDLGAFLVQLSGEEGSHITAPAIHLTRERAAEL
ncbi:MAG: LUD domain-containing protein, partial [Pyrobaculum sp.]|nr:LUD domain-containing protein [Pyrobaculum sp.]